MTRVGGSNGEVVRLSPGTWVALIACVASIAVTVVGSSWNIQGRLTTAETTIAAHEKRLDHGDARDEVTRREFVAALNELRIELKNGAN